MAKAKTLDEVAQEMRVVGEQLIPYTYPMADRSLGSILNVARIKEVVVDGYPLVIHYSKADCKNHFTETVQVYGKFVPFLPFNLCVKIGRKFLGSSHLFLVEQLKEGQKIYCWNVVLDREGKPMKYHLAEECEPQKYEDFDYLYLTAAKANIG